MADAEAGSTSGQSETGHSSMGAVPDPDPIRPRPPGRVWAIALAFGVAAGLLAWFAGEWAYGAFRPRLFKVEVMGLSAMQPSKQSQEAADLKNAALAFAILGGVTGLVMGLAGGLASGTPRRGAIAGVAGLLAGSIVGILASIGSIPFLFRQLVPDLNDLLTPILILGAIWMAIGAVGGSVFAIGMGSRQTLNALGGASLGALLAAIVYHLLGGFFLDLDATKPLAGSPPVRLLAMLMATTLIAAGAARGSMGYVPRPRGAPGP